MPIDLQHTTVLLELWRATRRATVLLDEALAGSELSPADFGLYTVLRFQGPLTPTRLAALAGSKAPTMSQALARLESRGHVERRPHPDDARSTLVSLTAAGERAHEGAGQRFRPLIAELDGLLGDDRAQIIYSLVRLDGVMRAMSGDERAEPPPRPDEARSRQLAYAGSPLSPDEEDEARWFIAWLRHRRSTI